MRLSATLSSASVSVTPGDEASVPVTVRNAGDTVEAYQIDVVGVPAEWVSIEPPTITLYPATTGTVTVTFRPPRSAAVRATVMPFGVHIVPAEHPDAAALEEGNLHVEPFRQLDAKLRPPTRAGRIGARYRVDIDNRGNVTERLRVASDDSTKQLVFSPRASGIAVPNDTEFGARQRVRARRLLWWGQPRELLFVTQIRRADGEDVEVATLDGRFIQRPIISAGLLKLLAALLALLLALLALWFGLLRPAVESAARDAADEAQAERMAQQATATPPQSPEPSGDAGPGGGAGARNGNGQGQGGTGPGGTGVTGDVRDQFSASVSFRTRPNGSASQSYTVPDGKVFLLTDFLVDNVQGDEGTLVVTANGVRVVSLALENFRNQDYHSVTPIRVPEKGQITLTVACRRAGTPANARPATTCSESLYLNGIMSNLSNP